MGNRIAEAEAVPSIRLPIFYDWRIGGLGSLSNRIRYGIYTLVFSYRNEAHQLPLATMTQSNRAQDVAR